MKTNKQVVPSDGVSAAESALQTLTKWYGERTGTAITVPMVAQLPEVTIQTNDMEMEVRARLAEVDKARKLLEAEKKAARQPLAEDLKKLDQRYSVRLTLLGLMRAGLDRGLNIWTKAQEAEAAKQQDKLNKDYDRKIERALDRSERTGEPMRVVAPPPVVTAPPKTVVLDDGTRQTRRTNWKWRLPGELAGKDPDALSARDVLPAGTDWPLAIPPEYWVLNTAMIGAVTRAGTQVPGTDRYPDHGTVTTGAR